MKKVSTAAARQSRNFSQQKHTIGLDLGDLWSWYCALDEAGAALSPTRRHPQVVALPAQQHDYADVLKSRRTRLESTKNPNPSVNGIAPNDAATQASGSTRAISANVMT
jgi:hypothetical protein